MITDNKALALATEMQAAVDASLVEWDRLKAYAKPSEFLILMAAIAKGIPNGVSDQEPTLRFMRLLLEAAESDSECDGFARLATDIVTAALALRELAAARSRAN